MLSTIWKNLLTLIREIRGKDFQELDYSSQSHNLDKITKSFAKE